MLVFPRRKTRSDYKKEKTPKQLERHFKGVANHHRIRILKHIAEQPGITVDEIAQASGVHFKTVSVHALKLVQAGLVDKSYKGLNVQHVLSPYGKRIHTFLKSF